MPEYSAGTAYVQLLPSLRGFPEKANRELDGYNPVVSVLLKPTVDPSSLPQSERDGDKAGSKYGDAFERAVKARVEAALKALPDVTPKVDATEADRKIAEIRAALTDLSKQKIGVDISADDALAKVEACRTELDALSKDSENIQVRVDTAQARSALAEVADDIHRIDSENAVVHVKFDVDRASLAAVDQEAAAAGKGGGGAGVGYGVGIASALGIGAGPLIGAGLAGVPIALAAIGVAADRSNAQVSSDLASMTNAAKATVRYGFAPMAPAIDGVVNETRQTILSLQPTFTQAATDASPLITTMSTGLLQAARDGITGTAAELKSLQPIATAVSHDFDDVAQGVVGLLHNLNVGEAAQGLSILGNDVREILPAVGSLLNEVIPLGNAILSVAGPAATDLARDLSILRPVVDGVSAGVRVLAPAIAQVAPPLLVASAASKALTGSWTDLGGAGQKLLSPLKNFDTTLSSLAGKIGITTASANAATKADLQATAAKAQLQAAADAETVAMLKQAGAADGSALEQLALADAQRTAAASAKEAATAEEALGAAAEGTEVALGPIGLALGAVGFALTGYIGKSDSASTSTQDLSQQLIQLGQASATAAASQVANSTDLQNLQGDLTTVGSSVQAFSHAYSGSAATAEAYTRALRNQQDALGGQHETITQTIQDNADQTNTTVQTTVSISELTDMVKNHTVSLDDLTPAQQRAVQQFESYGRVLPQAQHALDDLRASQQVEIQQLASEGIVLTATQQKWGQIGTAVGSTVSSFNDATSGIKNLTDNLLAAEQTDQQAVANFAQLGAAVVQAQQGYDSATQGVADAQHSLAQASQSIADARHSEQQAALGVANAEQQLADAQRTEAQAQNTLTLARQQAAQQLADLNRQVTDQADSEAEARLRLVDAQQAVNAAGLAGVSLASLGGPTAANEASYKLLLQLQEAQHGVNDTLAQGATLQQQQAAAQAAGIDGSAQVIQAQDQLAQSQRGVASASQGVADAQYAEQQAHRATQDAMYAEGQASQALHNAIQQQAAAAQALTQAKAADSTTTDINSAAGLRNFQTIESLWEANFKATGNIQDATAATQAQGQQMHFTQQQVQSVIDTITKVPAQTQFSIIGTPSLNLGSLLNQAANEGISPYSLGLPSDQVATALGQARGGAYATSGYADGGRIVGPGGPRDDMVPLWGSAGEFMQPASSVGYYGLSIMEGMRDKSIPREAFAGFAQGGPISTNGPALLGLNYRLLGWDGYLQGVSSILQTFGAHTPNLPITAAGKIDLGAFQSNAKTSGSNGSVSYNSVPAASGSAAVAQAYALSVLGNFGWGPDQMPPLIALWNQESGWNANAVNPSSGAYGIPQALGHGHPYNLGDYANQIQWGLSYIKGRYGSPAAAEAHELANHWYDNGGWLAPGLTMVHNDTRKPEAVLTNDQWTAITSAHRSDDGPFAISGSIMVNGLDGHIDGRIARYDSAAGRALTTGTR